jgi:hypothetical protein
MRKFFFVLFILSLGSGSCNAQVFKKSTSRRAEKELFGKSRANKKQAKVREPRAVLKAKKKQAAKERELKRNYEKSIKKSQERTQDIQTPEVKARMKKNRKDTATRDRAKKKKIKISTKKVRKKYN